MNRTNIKPYSRILLAGGSLILVVAIFLYFVPHSPRLSLGGQSFAYERADTTATREHGLSDRNSLPADHAMLFVFSENGQNCFWMKDMHFPLDIIWLNDQKQVIYTKENARPESYPESFCPETYSRYVVEVNAGVVHETGLKLGDRVRF